MPFVAAALFLFTMYSVKPLEIVSSYLISGTAAFFLMVWIGMTTAQSEQPAAEQMLYLRMENAAAYYGTKFIFLVCIAFIMGIFFTFFPVLQNYLNGGRLFTGRLGVFEILNAFFVQFGMGIGGSSLGNFLHPRVMKDRKFAIVLTVFASALCIAMPAIIQWQPALKWVLWIFPPATITAEVYGAAQSFRFSQTFIIFGVMLLYAAVYGIVKSIICHKNLF